VCGERLETSSEDFDVLSWYDELSSGYDELYGEEQRRKFLQVVKEVSSINHVVKCRPPENRDPLEDEILSCSHFTNSIIQLIQPSIIVTLGNHAGRYVIEFLGGSRWYGVSRMRGSTSISLCTWISLSHFLTD